MAEQKLSAAPRPTQGVRRFATPSGVTHVRTCLSGQYVVVGNHLAQHRELSLTAIGLATHIFSVPESTPVDIRSLAERFPEGRDRIAFALRVPPQEPARSAPLHEKAVALLAGLRRADERFTLSLREVRRLAPAVVDWFERGVGPVALRHTLTADLPVVMKYPAGVLAYRLRELLPPPLPAAPEPPPVTGRAHRPPPFQECDGCDRVFRAPEPGRCRDCRHDHVTGGGAANAA
ncbi:helix-turn-helix domain-containing protein [Streptomyces albogriseolus]|uniref:helix-turn-helix domain-containing protein n=1 Tax=Streptomyces albogriseolus TaxID=1887 RepID=UPI0033A04189